MRLLVLCLLVFVSSGFCDRDRPYIDFKLVSITARSSDVLNRILGKLQNIDDVRRDDITNSIEVIVSPEDADTVSRIVTEEQAEFKVLHHNLQESVDEEFQHLDMRRMKRQALTLEDSVKEFLLLDEIYEFQDRIVSSCNILAQVEKKTIGYSAYNNPINVMKISKHGSAEDKKTIFIEAGIHAREWLTPATANYMIFQLACKEENSDMLDLFNWEIISTFNPDGYEYTHTGYRYWRKNMQRNGWSSCIGTDLNRNFGAGFGLPGASTRICDWDYRGPYAYSAPEAKALKDHILSIQNDVASYLAIHTYGQFILLPYGYKGTRPSDYATLVSLAEKAEDAMGIPLKIGSAYGELYPASGISADFARDIAKINFSYTWELMPNEDNGQFVLEGFAPNKSMVPVYTPIAWRGIRGYAKAVAVELNIGVEETTTTAAATTPPTGPTKPDHISSYLWNVLQTKKDSWWYPLMMEWLLASKPGDYSKSP